jgi:hypothetical protein
MAEAFGCDYTLHLRLSATLTLVVENFFSLLKRQSTMPTCVQISQQFARIVEEIMKKCCACAFIYLTSTKPFYQTVRNSLRPKLRFSSDLLPKKEPFRQQYAFRVRARNHVVSALHCSSV